MILAEVMFKHEYGWVAVHYADICDKHDTNLQSFLRLQRFEAFGILSVYLYDSKSEIKRINESKKLPFKHL